MRCIGIDVHRDFCEVAIADEGHVHSAGRFSTQPDEVVRRAQVLRSDDVVTLEATSNALAVARLIEPFARVVLANPKAVKGTTAISAKTDKIDARTLATLLAEAAILLAGLAPRAGGRAMSCLINPGNDV